MVGLIAITLLFIVYALLSRRLTTSSITGPMMFAAAGILLAVDLLGHGAAIDAFSLELRSGAIQVLLEATLVIVLFSDAVTIDVRAVRKDAFLPSRLLGVGLPITIALGTLIAMVVFPGIGFWTAALVAVILAPTDAALGQAVVANEEVPDLVRQGLGVESGLNDGIAVPFLTIAVAGAAGQMQTGSEIATVFIKEIGLAVLVGLAVGWLGAKAVRFASERGWMAREGRQIAVVFLAVLCFALADPIDGSGFIAAFVGGMTFGSLLRKEFPSICNFSEGVSHLMTMAAFFVFGGLIFVPVVGDMTWQTVVYAVLSLTVIRMVPVAIALIGTNLRWQTKTYVGWFGPRGLASLVFLGTVVIDARLTDTKGIVAVGALTVAFSVFLHGLSAWPASVRYAAWFRSLGSDPDTAMVEDDEAGGMSPESLGGRLGPDTL
ncbi:MAG: cation:proton antiporter [Acidimicrobiia bacterium]